MWPNNSLPQVAEVSLPAKPVDTLQSIKEQEVVAKDIQPLNDIENTALTKSTAYISSNSKTKIAVSTKAADDFPREYDLQKGFEDKADELVTQISNQKELDAARKGLNDQIASQNDKVGYSEDTNTVIASVTQEEIEDNTELPSSSEPQEDTRIAEVTLSRRQKILAFVTNKPIQRITNTTAAILVKARNPKLKVKPDFKSSRPSLNIKFESEGYEAIASLQPFKKKNK